MKTIMLMFDSLNKKMLSPYGCDYTHTENFLRLSENTVTFENCYVGSMPCMPARRELHTGRYNFLHRSWGPIEPFDDSMPEILKNNGIHSHLVTDHYHYFEDGGATYHTRYRSYEAFRGQEGDAWKGVVGGVLHPEHRNGRENSECWSEQDFVNRSFMDCEEKQPLALTFNAGMEFIKTNRQKDNWFVQIETFDPHEPFFSQEKYKKLYPHKYSGALFDWPPYAKVTEDDESINHLRMEYAALLSMCDEYLGKLLDLMDSEKLWEDTMLIVCTDHGFMLGEHGHWAKCYFPFYNEIANTPLFLYDPNTRKKGVRCNNLVQTIDIAPTILKHFNLPVPKDMQGIPLQESVKAEKSLREGALFGIFGGQVNCTDGKYVYMKSPCASNDPLYEYTLMPTRHGGRRSFIDNKELMTMEKAEPFSFTKGLPLMKLNAKTEGGQYLYKTRLFDIENDPEQLNPLCDSETESRMQRLMKKLMQQNDAPMEQYERLMIKE